MVMKLLITLSVLVACSMAVPNPPSTFQAKISTHIRNGSRIIAWSREGYMAQDYNRKMFITCSNYTAKHYKPYTVCHMMMMRTPNLVSIDYIKLANGTVFWCKQTDLGEKDFDSYWDWLQYATPVGKRRTCFHELNQWQCNANNITATLGVSESDPNTPVSYNYTENLASNKIQQDITCFREFTSELPPITAFSIPNKCQSTMPQPTAQQQWEKKSMVTYYLQHQMKLNRLVDPRL